MYVEEGNLQIQQGPGAFSGCTDGQFDGIPGIITGFTSDLSQKMKKINIIY